MNYPEHMLDKLEEHDAVIHAAKKTVEELPEQRHAELRREFERAEAEAEFIRTHPGSRQ